MKMRPCQIALSAFVLLFLNSCGGSGSGNSNVADGGISGTGEGAVTGYGSIIINDTRRFEIGPNTQLLIDGEPVTEQTLQSRGSGFVARVDVGRDVSADFSSGTAVNVFVKHQVKGPVTSLAPSLEVLGQPVFTTGDTVLPNSLVVASLMLLDLVEVSGNAGTGNTIQATRLELKPGGIPVWKLTGPVSNLSGATLTIGTQNVDFTGVTPRNCGAGLADGDLVEIKATNDPGFTPGATLDTVSDVECQRPGLDIPPGSSPVLEAEIEGIVDSVSLPSLSVDGQQVLTTGTTVYEGGDSTDIVVGAKLEAEGDLNAGTGILTADKIRFRDVRVRMEGPVENVTPSSIQILGLTSLVSPLTVDQDGTLVSGSPASNVEVRGFIDSSGTIHATRIRERGPLDPTKVRLRGPVTGTPVLPDFAILNVPVNTSGGPPTYLPIDDQAVFFSSIAPGTQVDVESGSYSLGTIFSTVNTVIEIEE